MIHLYEKVCKTSDNEYGIREIIDENPFKHGPCIVTVLALPTQIRDVNGMMRQAANMVNPEIDQYYDPDRRVFGVGFGDVNEYGRFTQLRPQSDDLDEFINKYFYPLFTEDGKKINVLDVMKNFRNITFLTYCNGTKHVLSIEERLKQKMLEIGYSDDEIIMALSQVCLAAVSGNVLKRNDTSTLAISFGDVNDSDFEIDDETRKNIDELGYGFITYGSSIGFGIADDGEHELKKHTSGNSVLSSRISCFINTSIENALENRNNKIIDPITYEKVQNAFEEINSKQL